MWNVIQADYVVVGSGIAGLTLSLLLSKHGRVVLITKGSLTDNNSNLAQGGIAAALSPDDHPALHGQDTLRTGQGLCDAKTVESFVGQAAEAIRFLRKLGVSLDCDADGTLHLGKEGAHSRCRIVHAGGDATGRTVMETLARHLQTSRRIDLWENTYVAELLIENGECMGVIGTPLSGRPVCFRAKAVVLATGGLGQLYRYTTNSPGCTGDGYALAYRAGAVLRDMEFVQFHPTALRTRTCPLPLVSEAVRGEGAILVNSAGERFMNRYHEWGELASRDIVSRAIYSEMQAGRDVYLDARSIPGFDRRFPTIYQSCKKTGIDPANDLIPIVPAAHYTMGGIETDNRGVTSVPRLFAIGEAASSGFHGANRLASNSLLEGLVMAQRAADALAECPPSPKQQSEPGGSYADYMKIGTYPTPELLQQVQQLMWTHAGIVRDESRLKKALEQLQSRLDRLPPAPTPDRNLLTAALLVVRAALWRRESRGAHFRGDFPEALPEFQTHSTQGGTYESVTRTPVSATGSH